MVMGLLLVSAGRCRCLYSIERETDRKEERDGRDNQSEIAKRES